MTTTAPPTGACWPPRLLLHKRPTKQRGITLRPLSMRGRACRSTSWNFLELARVKRGLGFLAGRRTEGPGIVPWGLSSESRCRRKLRETPSRQTSTVSNVPGSRHHMVPPTATNTFHHFFFLNRQRRPTPHRHAGNGPGAFSRDDPKVSGAVIKSAHLHHDGPPYKEGYRLACREPLIWSDGCLTYTTPRFFSFFPTPKQIRDGKSRRSKPSMSTEDRDVFHRRKSTTCCHE